MTHVFIACSCWSRACTTRSDVLPLDPAEAGGVQPGDLRAERQPARPCWKGRPPRQLWPYIWPALLMGMIVIPLGLWVFGQAERYAKRTGKLHRNG